jgi:hypothetical protein
MIWRRLLVRSDCTIADLHYTLQIAFGWSDSHLHRFHIHGKAFGQVRPGNEDTADRVEQAIYDACAFLAERAMRGHFSPDLTPVRFVSGP